ncbi:MULTISPECIES: ABC transporter ATP-binding protein [Limnochorda]|uniref:ABC transporter ATP-binding protein n=1 Tax=Limnochorda TaxID=1676651 RepID=UPI001D1AD856|nr:ABC transporter ATP-binding protein [Limnochorda pilosa]MBO2486770.1 peptide ABC transporter ATP-binding protein [Bacillota bacterium]MBO2519489.1 peptide ABC transporter ATP-binding protein [Bacillota bacterium]
MAEKLLELQDLKTYFFTEDGVVPAVDGVSFGVDRGGSLGVVGESGCGKSVTALSIMRLIPQPPGKIVGGKILFNGEDLVQKKESEMRRIRGNEISMIFQEPMTSLNPVFTVGDQIMEAIILHQKLSKKEARERAIEMLRLVGIPDPHRRVDEYPHQMSGGMRQRVMIAMALSCNPKLLIADEPTTALDVTIQAQILDLMRRLREEVGAAIILITHDLGVVAELVEHVVVMYAGKVVEKTDVRSIFAKPSHPYTEGLLESIPKLHEERERLQTIEGVVPSPYNMPAGCRFHPRCPLARDICRAQEPPLMEVDPGHWAACWKHTDFEPIEPMKEVG